MTPQDFLAIFNDDSQLFRFFFKSFAIIGSTLFVFYSLAVLRQTYMMLRTIEETGGSIMRIISWSQLIIAIILAFLAWIFL